MILLVEYLFFSSLLVHDLFDNLLLIWVYYLTLEVLINLLLVFFNLLLILQHNKYVAFMMSNTKNYTIYMEMNMTAI
jgi:hypothetical protein